MFFTYKTYRTRNTLAIISICVGLLFFSHLSFADNDDSLEIKLKAAYLYNFLRFVEWPRNNHLSTNICIYGIKENYRKAFNTLSTISKKSQKITIDFFSLDASLNLLDSCQITFITDKANNKYKPIIEHLKDTHALIVGESHGFIQSGGMINFIRVEDKVKFEINPESVKASGLKMSSKVLRIAERLVSEEDHE